MRSRTSRAGLLCCVLLLQSCADPADDGARTAAAVAVETLTLSAQPLVRELLAVGSLRSDESVTIRSEIAGRIAQIGFDEGQSVRAGQLLFALDDSIDRAALDQARADHLLASRSFERSKELSERKLVSSADRDQASANLAAASAALAGAQARLAKSRILAPFSGIAGLRMVSPGDYINVGQDLVNLEAMETMKADFRVDQSALPVLRAGQALEAEVDAYPDERFSGEVYAIDPRISDSSRSIALRARLPNPDGRLRPGQFARLRLVVERKESALVIPEEAIFPRGTQQFVFVVVDGRAQLREIRLGQRDPGTAEVLEGLQAGDVLVVAGVQQLKDGAQVRDKGSAVAGP